MGTKCSFSTWCFCQLTVFIICNSTLINAQSTTNYHLIENWAVLPNKVYPYLLETIKDSSLLKSLDVFYIYPTFLIDSTDKRWNTSIEDAINKNEVLENAVRFQASAWAESGRMFIPYYQQAHLRSYRNLDNGGRNALLLAYSDIKAAFEYYLENFNHGRGIILAGHSQGSTHINLLLKDFFDGKPLQKQLVVAYLPGIGVEKDEYKTIPFSVNPLEVGGFVSWNTFKNPINLDTYNKWYKGKAVINPITWDLSPLTKRKYQRGFYYKNSKKYKRVFQTNLIDGALVLTRLRFPFNLVSKKMASFHIGDVNLFWDDIRQNSKQRGKTWIIKNGL